MTAVEISVVIPSHDRPTRLRWLLNALEEQTLERGRWEVLVAHDSAGPETEALLREHPLADVGVLRHLSFPAGSAGPATKRNAGWRAAAAPLIAFTDDDCRPEPGWLAALLAAAHAAPGAMVQGATRPDPREELIWAAPHVRSIHVTPPDWFAQTCNILYPIALLEALGGLGESFPGAAGEDTDLALRARAAGARLVAAPGAVVYHAVESFGLRGMVRLNWRWRHLAHLVHLRPEIREEFTLHVFWRRQHLELLLAAGGLAGARHHPLLAVLAVPYLHRALNARGPRKSARLACAVELPGRVVVDAAELGTMLCGSVTHRALVL
ncbi:MAG: glycosyltransferase [Solirubrobacterales bacterium]|nr:glycosyltransferase [Solirubrobacterales bacterium]